MSSMTTMINKTVGVFVSVNKASAKGIHVIHATWSGQTMNEANYVSSVAEPMKEALKASGLYTTDGSLRKACSITKLVILAVCNGETPTEGENVESFAQRMRDGNVLVAKGVCKPRKVKAGASKRKEGKVRDKGRKASKKARKDAALLLASNNLADAQALEYLSATTERMALLRQVYAKLTEADAA